MSKKLTYQVVKGDNRIEVTAHKAVTTDGDCLVFMNWIEGRLQPVVMFSSSEWERCILEGVEVC